MRIARMHSRKTPFRSTMMSWIFSRPSRWTFQYIDGLGEITGFLGFFGPCRIWPDSFGVISSLLSQPGHQALDLRIDQRLTTTDRNHRRVALRRGLKAILQRHYIFHRGRILPDTSATGAGQIAGMERLELKNGGELLCAPHFVPNNVPGDFQS